MNPTKESADESLLVKAVVEDVKWAANVLRIGSLLAVAVLLVKFVGGVEFEFVGVKIPIWSAGIALLMLTAWHFFAGQHVVRSTHDLWATGDEQKSRRAFDTVVLTGGWFVRKMMPRTEVARSRFCRVFLMNWKDFPAWLCHAAAAVLVLAMLDWSSIGRFITSAILGCSIAAINWFIGSRWMIAISELSIPCSEGKLHKEHAAFWSAPSGCLPPSMLLGCGIMFFVTPLLVLLVIWIVQTV